jgi:tetratricopeptide (TPR) repeat protein
LKNQKEIMTPKELLLKANKAIKADNLILATELFSKILNQFPKHSAAKAGLNKIKKLNAISLPSRVQDELNVVINTVQSGDFKTALDLAQNLTIKDPNNAIVYNIIGISYINLQKPGKAIPNFKTALRLNKKYNEARCNLGSALLLTGNTDEAIIQLERTLEENPKNLIAWNSLGNAKKSKNSVGEAKKAFKQALFLDPSYLNALNSYGVLLSQDGEYKKSIKQFESALEISSTDMEIFTNYLNALAADDQTEKAIQLLKESSTQVSRSPRLQLLMAELQARIGNLEKSIDLLTKLIRQEPNYFEAYRLLSSVHKFKESDEIIVKMEEIYNTKTLNVNDTIQLGFSLGKAFHDIGEYDKAFYAYKRANQSRRQELIYDSNKFNQTIADVKKTLNRKWINTVKNLGDKSTKPIFILGMNRSGTTLVEQILSSHSKVTGGGEIPFLNRFCFKMFNNLESWKDFNSNSLTVKYLEQLNLIDEHAPHVTDKMPLNFAWIGLIKAILPNAKIIHLIRNPMDTCLSNYRNNFDSAGNGFAYDQKELANFYHQYRQLMHHWYSLFPNEIFRCDYDKLVSNQEDLSKSMIDYCNLSWEPGVLEFHKNKRTIQTASIGQVRSKIYKSSVSGWERYEKHLKPMYRILDQSGCFEPWEISSFN